jgi:hypothetical protein
MVNQLMIKEIITLNHLKAGNREEALKMCRDYNISQYRLSELEKMANESK